MTDLFRQCPSCDENYRRGYQDGYMQAMEMFGREVMLASLQRPIIMKVPLGFTTLPTPLK